MTDSYANETLTVVWGAVKGAYYRDIIINQQCLIKRNRLTTLVFTTRLPDTAAFMVGDKIVLECETANEAMQCRWTQNGRDLANSKHVKIANNGTIRQITIDACTLSDDSMFRQVLLIQAT